MGGALRVRLRVTSVAMAACAISFTSSCSDDTATGASSSSGSSSSSSSSGEGGSSGVVGTGSTINELCWSTINAHRAKDGLPPFKRWTEIEACSDGEAKRDGENNDPHGSFPKCGELAQNECPGFKGPPEKAIPSCLGVMYSQPRGEGHRANMESTKWTKVACGTFVTASGMVWSVQNYR